MNDNGIDAETLSSTMHFLINGTPGNGVCPINLGLEFNRLEDQLEIVNFAPTKTDSEDTSDEEEGEDNNDDLLQRIQMANGNYSNEFIEEHWSVVSEESSRPAVTTVRPTVTRGQLRRGFDMLRESVNELSLTSNSQNLSRVEDPPEEPRIDNKDLPEEPRIDNKDLPEVPRIDNEDLLEKPKDKDEEQPEMNQKQKKPKKRRMFKNVAIESLLGNKNITTEHPAEQENINVGIASTSKYEVTVSEGLKPPDANGSKPPVANGSKSRRGRGRIFNENSRRNDISMVRPESIHGYHANSDYDPKDYVGNRVLLLDDFPPL